MTQSPVPAPSPGESPPARHGWRPTLHRLRPSTFLGIQSKFLIMLLVVSVISTMVIGGLGFQFGTRAIERKVYEQLTSVRAARASSLEQYFGDLRSQATIYSADPTTVAALREFGEAFRQLQSATVTPEHDRAIADFYRTSFLPKLTQNTEGKPTVNGYLPTSAAQRYLQFHYTIPTDDFAAKVRIDDARDGSAWSAAHRRYQPFFREIALRFRFDDVMLIDGATGEVVYSAYKGHDLGTNLDTGVYADSVLGRAFREVRRAGDPQYAYFADYERYRSSYNTPAGFILSPVFDGARQLGVLALQIPTSAIDDRMTSNRGWATDGLGQSGECFLVGPDRLMRSNARTLLEDPARYRSQVVAAGLSPEQADRIVRLNSTIIEQPVRSESVERALRGESGTSRVVSFRGVPVLASYTPLRVAGLNWVIACSQETGEAFASADDFARQIAIATVGLIVLVAIIALFLAQFIARPIRRLTIAARAVAGGDLGATVPVTTRDEIGELGESFNEMTRALRAQDAVIREREAENDRLLANLMPSAVARRFKGGEREIAERHAQVTILFADIRGFVELARTLPPDAAAAALNRLIAAFDDAAERHGVEKFKTVGASYLAVCGLTVPRVDGEKRAVDLALELRRIVVRFNREGGTALELRAGIDSGEITAGIVGRRQFVYDMWGDAVGMAARALRAEAGGGIVVTQAVADRLVGIYDFAPAGTVATRSGEQRPVLAVAAGEEG